MSNTTRTTIPTKEPKPVAGAKVPPDIHTGAL